MGRILSSNISDAIATHGNKHVAVVEIELPFKDGDDAPIIIRVASASGIAISSQDDFIVFTYKGFSGAFDRIPTAAETSSWDAALQTGLNTSEAALLTAAQGLIAGLFSSSEYTDRARSDDQFVSDLYLAYFGRAGDPAGLEFWVAQVSSSDRATVQEDGFNTALEFTARVSSLKQESEYEPDVRELGSMSLTDGVAIDGGDLSLQNLADTYGIKLAETDRRLYPAIARFKRAFLLPDGTYEVDTIITGQAQFTSVDGNAAKVQITSDMSRKGLNVIQEVTQRCAWTYKGPGCDTHDSSPTCSRIFDDDVNGCASKEAAPQIIDLSPPNNQPRFKGVPPLATNTGPTSGLTTDNVTPEGWPSNKPFDPNSPLYRKLLMLVP